MSPESSLPEFDAVAYAKEALSPLLVALMEITEESGESEQLSFFSSIHAGIERAGETNDLADPFMMLSMSAFRGFQFTRQTMYLLDLLLDKAHVLSEALSTEPEELN